MSEVNAYRPDLAELRVCSGNDEGVDWAIKGLMRLPAWG